MLPNSAMGFRQKQLQRETLRNNYVVNGLFSLERRLAAGVFWEKKLSYAILYALDHIFR